jgi:chemotaxis family two-component system sensor kinase Cph1
MDVLESMDDGLFILDKEYKFLRVNRAFEEIAHIKRESVLGKNLWEAFPHATTTSFPYWIQYHDVIASKKSASFVVEGILKDWTEINAYPTEEGGLCVFVRDITDKMKSEQALRKSEERFRALVNASSDVIYRMSPDWTEMHQLDGRDFLAHTRRSDKGWIQKYIPKKDQKRVLEVINKAIAKKGTFQLEHPVKQADGSIGWTYSRAIPILDDDGNIIEWFGAATDVTPRKKAEEDQRTQHETEARMELITQQRNALLKVNQIKDEFIALASHQLRTPATVVKQYISLLLGKFAGELNSQQQDFLQIAYDSNERELKIINELLKTAQIDSTNYGLSIEEHDVVDLVKGVITDFEATLAQHDQRIQLENKAKSTTLLIDATEIRLVISNLIENASKYSPIGSDIKVVISPTKKYTRISVQDNGVGISKKDHRKVFEKFTRVNNELSNTVSGTGLGLYWVKQIVEAHNGNIELSSVLGKGSTFTVKLPI